MKCKNSVGRRADAPTETLYDCWGHCPTRSAPWAQPLAYILNAYRKTPPARCVATSSLSRKQY